jgi:hypothetical protein
MKTTKILVLTCFFALSVSSISLAVDNTKVMGYKKPDVCLKSNIRCILKKQAGTLYWCLKSNLQRNLDARRTTTPIRKTRNEILGHCAKIIPIRE